MHYPRARNVFARSRKPTGGFSVLETLIYLAVLTLLSVAVVAILLSLSGVYGNLVMSQRINGSASAMLDRMAREARAASGVDTASSTLGVSPGVLVLNTTDAEGDPLVRSFYIDGEGVARMTTEGGAAAGRLTHDGVTVTELIFRHVPGARAELVVIEAELSASYRNRTKTESFQVSAVLRDSY